ncbi:hypothetical protein [Opitutus terrae]|uniref:Methyltransferase type 12 n=1 Tax=Opitutus terrae (strain DSM 11246 / JCM 15787 / PB90-1) TaxID=452637 RepID=B1ZWF8_OPITP|nr:hypothetical protein [Opitutus terrae]ACB76910.1 conserved hypothetical protein [Opitutus terrae PB90-1]
MLRAIQPELLDGLPPEHPDALGNRRDLRRLNQLMGNHRWIARTLDRHLRPREYALELGAGQGELTQQLFRRGLRADALDRWPRPAGWPAALAWHQADLQTFDAYDHYPVVFGNLIFHQFDDAQLAALGAQLRRSCRLIVACEPARRKSSQVAYRLLAPLLGFNRVSRHDGHVSIAGGFVGTELPRALGFTPADWALRCRTTWRGAYHFVAIRR